MNLNDLINPEYIHLDKEVDTLEEILKYCASLFAERIHLPSKEIYKHLQYRERLGGTCIGEGVIIPHSRIDQIDDILIEIVRVHPSSSIPCGDSNLPLRLVFAVISSSKVATEYIKVLKAITALICSRMKELLAASTELEFIEVIKLAAIPVDRYPVASDLASPALMVKVTDSISRAVDIMKQNKVEYLAVTDPDGTFVGVVDFLDLLKTSFPRYVFSFEDLSFLSEFEPLKEFLTQETKGTVKDFISNNAVYTIDANVSYVEVVYRFVKHRQAYVYVIENHKLCGIITADDLISKLLRS
jgi:PTS system nitrogen regulatory IIA component